MQQLDSVRPPSTNVIPLRDTVRGAKAQPPAVPAEASWVLSGPVKVRGRLYLEGWAPNGEPTDILYMREVRDRFGRVDDEARATSWAWRDDADGSDVDDAVLAGAALVSTSGLRVPLPSVPKLFGHAVTAEMLVGLGITASTSEPIQPAATQSAVMTFGDLATCWTKGNLHRDHPDHVEAKSSSDDDAQRLEILRPALGHIPLSDFATRGVELADDALRRVDDLRQSHEDAEAKAAQRAPRKVKPATLAKTTRRQYAQVIHRVLSLAAYPARILAINPLPRGWLPSVGTKKARGWLYPDEDASLVACAAVGLVRRVFYGFVNREGMRTNEALKLKWDDLDLKKGVVRLDENKTKSPRSWVLGPGTREALVAWHHLSGTPSSSSLVFNPKIRVTYIDKRGHERNRMAISKFEIASDLRNDLKLALGSDARVELFESTKNRLRLRAHDLRATFVTISLANGKTEDHVMQRTGHTTSQQLQNYRRDAATVRELNLGSLVPLNEAIPELREVLLSGAVAIPADCAPTRSPLGVVSARPLKQWAKTDLNCQPTD